MIILIWCHISLWFSFFAISIICLLIHWYVLYFNIISRIEFRFGVPSHPFIFTDWIMISFLKLKLLWSNIASHSVRVSFFLVQCFYITVAVVYCIFLFGFSSQMIATTRFYCRFYREYFSEWTHYCRISIYVLWNISAQRHSFTTSSVFYQHNGEV